MNSTAPSWFLADDFSGVLEVGALWRKSGKSVTIVLDAQASGGGGEICGISSETRNATEADAGKRLTSLLKTREHSRLRFKKIDSTMRGPVGAELCAVTRCLPGRHLIFTPANPRAGRVVREGRLYVDGVPVSSTPFAADPVSPVTKNSLQEIIAETGGPQTTVVSYESSATSDRELRNKLETAWKESQVLIVDSSTIQDLERITAAAKDVAPDFLACGSGGLASAMVRVGLLADLTKCEQPPKPKRGRVLFVVGSLHPQSRKQIRFCVETANVPVEFVSPAESQGRLEQLLKLLQDNGALIMASQVPSAVERGGDHNVHRHAAQLAELAAEICTGGFVDTLFVTGGETARAVVDGLGCGTLSLETEFQPGVAVATLGDFKASPRTLIVKPGSFGGQELLAQILSTYGANRSAF